MSLNKTALGMAQIASQGLVRRDIVLQAKEETPLHLLTSLSTQQLTIDAGIRVDGIPQPMGDLTASLESSANEPLPGEVHSEHTVVMGDYEEALAKALANVHDVTQNKVNPAIKRVVTAIETHLENNINGTLSPLDLVVHGPDAIFSSIYLAENVGRFASSLRTVRLLNLKVPAADVAAIMATGHSAFDQEISEFVARVGADYVAGVWDQVFNSSGGSTSDLFRGPGKETAAVAAFIFSARAQVDIPAGLDIDISQWRQYCSAVHAAAGGIVHDFITTTGHGSPHTPMVLDFPREDQPIGVIKVDKSKYEAFCAAGGCAELIFAAAYGDQQFDPQKLIARADELKTSWQYIQAAYQNSRAAQRHGYVVEALRTALAAEIAEAYGATDEAGATYEHMRQFVRAQNPLSTTDLWKLARYGVCNVVYKGTDALTLLEAMDAQAALSPDLSPRELAFFGTIELVAQWLFNQMQVSLDK